MFNLITLIVSVALAAAMAGAGLFYAGNTMTQAGPRAQAVGIVSALQQIDAAWTMYVNDGKTDDQTAPTMDPVAGAPGTDLLADAYLSSVPPGPATFSIAFSTTPSSGYVLDLHTQLSAASANEVDSRGIFLAMTSAAGGVCTQIAALAGQPSVPTVATAANVASALQGRKYACMEIGAATFRLNNVGAGVGDPGKHLVYMKR